MVWDARPLTPETALEREALGLLAWLFAKPLRQEDVKEFLNSSPTITPPVRQLALSLVDRYHEETQPEAYYQASWAVAPQRFLNAFQYRFALWQAQAASHRAPDAGAYQTALGVAQYRAGQYPAALATLTRADHLHRAAAASLATPPLSPALITIRQARLLSEMVPANLAFQAMAQYRLGQTEAARTTLARVQEIVRSPAGEPNREPADFLREAEDLLAGR
jgi:hypothetical protein